jgi:hypothetical protein
MPNTRLAILLLPVLCLAQDPRATISGQVTDETGAAIPGARVRLVQRSTSQKTEQATNADGYFSLPLLQPSTYDLEVEAGGFSKYRSEPIALMVAQKLDLPIRLKIGSLNDAVTVSALDEQLQTADASGGVNFDSLQTSEYPLNGRQVYMLMDLSPGVLFTQEQFGSSGYSGTRGWDVSGAYVMNGGVSGTNSFSLNGAPISLTGSWQVAPNIDAIQEFKVMTNTYDAAIGRTGGGSVNTTLKSGSNQWHGTLFEFLRNSILDANYTQNNQVGAPRGKHITNQFGGTLGGALRKDRDFIFVSFEGFRERVPFPVVASVPPMDLRDGQHFTKYGMSIYDPLTGHVCVSKVDVTGTCASTFIRSPFPGNVIPSSRISPVAVKLLSYYPAPNTVGLTQNYVYSNSTGRYEYNQPIVRYDHSFSQDSRLSTTLTFQHGSEYRNQTGIPGTAASGNIHTQRQPITLIADWTRTFHNAIFDVRLSFGRFTSYFPDAELTSGVTAKQLGINIANPPTTNLSFPPRILMDQFSDLFGNGTNMFTWGSDNQWNLAPTVTLSRGTKTIKFGADLVYAARSSGSVGNPNGQLQFNRYATQQYPLHATTTSDGSGIADLLLGVPGAGFADWNDTYYRTWPYFGFFVQADWKARRNLTLNIGLRYDVQVPWVERWNRVNNGFDFNSVNPLSDQVLANWRAFAAAYNATNPKYPYPAPPAELLGGLTFVQPGGYRRTYLTDWQNIQPRFGLAWQFAHRTVLRTGFGIYHRTATQNNDSQGFSQQTGYIRTLTGDQTPAAGLTGPYSLQDPFPNGLLQPTGASLGLATNIGNAVLFDGSQRVIPRTFQYSFGLQRTFRGNILIDASYVGSITNHDTIPVNLDYLSMSDFLAGQAASTFLDRTLNNPFYGVLPKTSTLGASPTITAKSLDAPLPLFNGITMGTNPWAHYRYDALQLRAEKRFNGDRAVGGALTVVFAYTFSKNFQTANYLNTWDIAGEKPVHELVSYDKPQNVSLSGVWDLPFGKGRRFLSNANRFVNGAIGGWNLNLTYRYNSGNPVNGIDAVFSCASLLVSDQNPSQWFNNTKSCFKGRASYTLRTAPDRYPWLRQMDNMTVNLSGAKTWNINERWRFNLRAEAFNLLNHPLYGAPDTGYQNARFGMLPVGQQNFPRLIQVSAKLLF